MKLERMQVSGFGRLNGLDVELPSQVTVLYGPNEAGKSTLLGFVRAMLFGIPSRALAAERYEPLRGGAHGGALTVLGDDGARWLIERYAQPPEGRNLPGTRGDRLRITRSDERGEVREATQEEMQRELLGGMSKAMFKQLFAVSLTELQEVGALQSEELSRYLFHAGIGGGAAVLRGEKRLVQEMDKLYRPRGRTQEIAQLLQAPSSGPVDWDEEERQLRRLMEAWLLWEQRHAALEGEADAALNQASALRDELAAARRELVQREAAFDELDREWEAWLTERRLSVDLSPEAASDVFRLAEQGRDWLSRLDTLNAKIAALRSENERFEQECLRYGDEKAELGQAAVTLSAALARLDGAIDLQNQLNQLSAQLRPLEEEGQRLDDRLRQMQESERLLLAEAGAADGEELLRLNAAREKREALERELRQLELLLFAGLDEAKRDELERLLQTTEESDLRQRLEKSEQDLRQAEALVGQLQEKRGRLLQEQENLAARCQRDDLMQQLEEQRAALRDRVDQYAVMAVCHELIGRARRVYEEERQPAVLQAASGYFAEMTGGTYRRIVMKMGTQELMAEHAELGPLESTLLSRGTAEQLYLSMRLALSEAVSGQAPLPLLLDDLFVNFDEGRLEGALSVLRTVADRQQIIMMTCHEHVVRHIQTLLPAAKIVRM
ncbi:ATP-binding protein [Paenibacillus phocaensis]|uniref:ATP-binding protein n=1 Tax=Paenibacillus phocaensis TaxID=1776378 RepID=UPI000839BEEF|nr:AAA family ATPase [Paenibacillus phocaensis]